MPDAASQTSMVRSRNRGLAFVVAASVLFAINGTVSKAALLAGLTSLQMTQIRVTGTFVILLVVVALFRPGALRVARHEWLLLVLYGLIGIVVVQTFYFIAIRRLPVGIALLIEYTAPLFVALWARFGQKRPVPRRFWGALALAFFGLTLVAQVWSGDGDLDRLGVLAGFGAAVSLAATSSSASAASVPVVAMCCRSRCTASVWPPWRWR